MTLLRPVGDQVLQRKSAFKFPDGERIKKDHTGFFRAPGPSFFIKPLQQGGTEGSGQMIMAGAPVETGLAQRPPSGGKRFDINAEAGKNPQTIIAKAQCVRITGQQAVFAGAVEHPHAKIASQVIVTDARLPQRRVFRAGTHP